MIDQKTQAQETVQSMVSYVGGGGLISASMFADLHNAITLYALIAGAIVITIRAIYDGIGLTRRIKNKDHGKRK